MSNIIELRSTLNKIRLLKKRRENSQILSNKQFKVKINYLRNKSMPSKKIKKTEDKFSSEDKFEKRFNKIDSSLNTINTSITGMNNRINEMNGTMNEMKGSMNEMNGTINEMNGTINDLFMLSILKENISEEKDKDLIKKYIADKYKKLLPKLLNAPPSDVKNEDKNNIPTKITNNITEEKNSSFVDKNNNNINFEVKKKYSFRKKSKNNKSNTNSSNKNSISFESINKHIKSDEKSVGDRDKEKNNKKNMGENCEKKNININNILKKEIRIGNLFNSNTNQSKNIEKKNMFERNELKQCKRNANIKNSKKKGSQTLTFKYTESMHNDSKGKRNPFSGIYSKDSNSSSLRKNK